MKEKFEPIDSLQVLAYIARYCKDEHIPLNVTKAQKLMYCVYGVILAKFDCRLIDEFPAAQAYGPVFPESLRSVQFFGIKAFERKNTPEVNALSQDVLYMINATIKMFGKFDAMQLSNWSRIKNSPWHRASHGGSVLYGRLQDTYIKTYFRDQVLA